MGDTSHLLDYCNTFMFDVNHNLHCSSIHYVCLILSKRHGHNTQPSAATVSSLVNILWKITKKKVKMGNGKYNICERFFHGIYYVVCLVCL